MKKKNWKNSGIGSAFERKKPRGTNVTELQHATEGPTHKEQDAKNARGLRTDGRANIKKKVVKK